MKHKTIYIHHLICYAIILIGLLLGSGCTQDLHAKQIKCDHWVGTWAASAQQVEAKLMPSEFQKLDDTTLRQVVRVSIGGEKLRVRFSNAFADWSDSLIIDEAYIAVSAGGNTIEQQTSKPLTFNGKASWIIPYGTLIVSDPVKFDLTPGSDLAITIHVQKAPKKTTGHRSARGEVVYIQSGNVVTEKELPTSVVNKCWYYLCGVEVLAAGSSGAVVCLGDSITDGKGSTEGQNRRWPDYLARRFQSIPETANIGVLNQGIGGNCLWSGGLGQTVLQRLQRDVLAQPGARWIILLEGINDLGGGKTTAEEIITSYKQIISRSQACGLLVYGSTILPCGESFYYKDQLEDKRQKINNWIRSSGAFDAVIDWDAVARDPQDPAKLRSETDCGDHLHLSDKGYQMMADAIDLNLFSESAVPIKSKKQSKPVAVFDRLEYSGKDVTADSTLQKCHYRNPILTGFYPDPSLCRVGKDYYLVNSTFEYFPGLPIFHSTDLVNWQQIGNVIHRPEQLDYRASRMSGGLYAPAINYHDGTFYVICTMVDGIGNFLVTAKDPAGPWSDPVPLNFKGIDPSLFFDDDGRVWVVNNDDPDGEPLYEGHRAVRIQQYDPKQQKMIGPRPVLINGGVDLSQKPIWIEGPHIYKRNNWYYLCCAEGGTWTDHTQVIFRSNKVDGPYTPWEKNPILTQRDLDDNVPNAVTCTGHADLEIGPDGKWWAVFLAVRPYINGLSPMGRETFLLPVQWTDNDWPMILEPGKRVPLNVKAPDGVTAKKLDVPLNGNFGWREEFDGKELGFDWIMVREPHETWWKLNGGKLELIPQPLNLYSGTSNPSFIARRVQHNIYTAATQMDIPKDKNVSAGLALFMNEKYHYFLAVKGDGKKARIYLEQVNGGQVKEIGSAPLKGKGRIELKVEVDKAICSFLYKFEGEGWKTLVKDADAKIITTGIDFSAMFLGATVGPHARIDTE
jgi:alpha-N-arabinofuranosidase